MNRPIYESDSDRETERDVVMAIWKTCGWKCYSTPTLACVDLVITMPDGTVKGFGEVRTRNMTYRHYKDVMFSAKKMRTIIQLSNLMQLPTYLILNLQDGIFVMKCPDTMDGINIKISGSVKRNDTYDIEENCHLPWEGFRRLDNPNIW